MNRHLIRPRVFADEPALFAAFTTRGFAPTGRAAALQAAERLGASHGFDGLAVTEQVHGESASIVRAPGSSRGSDGLVTDQAGLLLGTVAADCAQVMLADVAAGVIGNCHAGWRGAVAGVVTNSIEQMESLGARSRRMLAYIGPCISLDAFEVGEEVAAQFDASYVERRAGRRPHVDLRGAVRQQLLDAGLAPEHIETSDLCTVRDGGLYSHRGEDGTTGRMVALIGLLRAAN